LAFLNFSLFLLFNKNYTHLKRITAFQNGGQVVNLPPVQSF